MVSFLRRKKTASPNGKPHEVRIADGSGSVVPIQRRERPKPEMTSEERVEVDWRKNWDRQREQAIIEGRSCGLCVDGVIQFKLPRQPAGQTECGLREKPGDPNSPLIPHAGRELKQAQAG